MLLEARVRGRNARVARVDARLEFLSCHGSSGASARGDLWTCTRRGSSAALRPLDSIPRGILREPKRTRSGYRAYPPDTVALIRFIKRAKEFGFTLEEAQELAQLRALKGKSRATVRALAQDKMEAVERKLEGLQAVRAAIAALLESCACSEGGATCPILEALERPGVNAAPPQQRSRSAKMKTISFSVEGMSCEGCASRIKSTLGRIVGVRDVQVDVAAKRVRVNFSPDASGAERFGDGIDALGYRVTARREI